MSSFFRELAIQDVYLRLSSLSWRDAKQVRYSDVTMARSFLVRTLQSFFCFVALCAFTLSALAADAPKPGADVVTFVNGEQISGKLLKVADGKVFFHSEMVGDVSFEWAKVKNLKTANPFAVIAKGDKLGKHEDKKVPEGMLELSEAKVAVAGASVPADQVNFVVDQPGYDKAMDHHAGWTEGWVGAVTAGLSLVEATQHNTNFTSGIALVRSSPGVDWLDTRSRTTLDFSNSYGKLTQPGQPDAKTNIYHADAEQDEYLSQRLYALGHVSFDHSFAQGLDLQSLFGGGLGYTVKKDKIQELDFKADLHYEKQQFADSSLNLNLIGSEFAETYLRKLSHGMVLNQGLLLDESWNNTHAYSAQGVIGLAAPISKKFSLAINLIDGFLNNPPPGFKKNSLQFTTGLTYTIK